MKDESLYKHIRLGLNDLKAYNKGLKFLKEINPYNDPSQSDVLRAALEIAFGAKSKFIKEWKKDKI